MARGAGVGDAGGAGVCSDDVVGYMGGRGDYV
jgi:hypothetical protein